MQAVCGRAYPAALKIFAAALGVKGTKMEESSVPQASSNNTTPLASSSGGASSSGNTAPAAGVAAPPQDGVEQELFLSMIYPPGSSLDNSPLHVICANDTCSFTWTGAEHIHQVILNCFILNPISPPRGLLVSLTYGTNGLTTLRATLIFVLMHSGIVNGHQLLCDAHTVLESHSRNAAFFFFTHYRPFPLFLFMCLSLLTVFFLGASIVCVNNL